MMMFVRHNVQNGPKITTSSSWKNGPEFFIFLSTQQSNLCSSLLCVCVFHMYVTQIMSHSKWVQPLSDSLAIHFFTVLLNPLDNQRVWKCPIFLFSLEILNLQCFSIRITVYSVFPRSMSLSQENEWLSLSEKKQNWYHFERTGVGSLQLSGVCVCVSHIYVTQSVSYSEWVSRYPFF